MSELRPHQRNTPEEYDRRWLARVKAGCTVDESGCWLWQGYAHPTWGYGRTCYRGRTVNVHRLVYIVLHRIQLKREQYVCHSCDVRTCCNPDHLWVGSNSDNQLDSSRKGRHYESRRTHCEHGHAFTPENTKLRPSLSGVRRVCKECELNGLNVLNGIGLPQGPLRRQKDWQAGIRRLGDERRARNALKIRLASY